MTLQYVGDSTWLAGLTSSSIRLERMLRRNTTAVVLRIIAFFACLVSRKADKAIMPSPFSSYEMWI